MDAIVQNPASDPRLISTASAGTSTDNSPTAPYASSIAHICAELERIDFLIQLQVRRARKLHHDDEFQGLYISEREVDSLMARPMGMPSWALPQAEADQSLDETSLRLKEQIEERKRASVLHGGTLRLPLLATNFDLTSFDVDVVLICLAGELDLRYERLYAYLQDDVTRKRPSVDLVLNLLCPSFEAKLDCRNRFSASAPLLKYHLVSLSDDATDPKPPLLARNLKLDDRIVNYLLGGDEIDVRLGRHLSLVEPKHTLDDLLLPEGDVQWLRRLVENQRNSGSGLNLYFRGPYGVGKRSTAGAICQSMGLKLLVVNLEPVSTSETDLASMVQLITREATLQQAAIYWQAFDSPLSSDHPNRMTFLLEQLQKRRGIVFLGGESIWEPCDTADLPPFIRIEFPRPGYSQRLQFWKAGVADHAERDLDFIGLASKFRFSGGQIRDAVLTARNLARRRDPDHQSVNMADLLEACRLQSNRKLASLATAIKPHYTWSDIVLPVEELGQLREICNAVEYRSIVYEQWGFDKKLSLGKGLAVLFAGPSGTGKTMAAEILARELGLDLYKIDLSTVISKYIGETEKNLSRIFTEAATSNAVLFFDEADALFGKRSEVRDSHDRYANIEINYLLQRMEEYDGTVILATNLRKNMDDAFVRRIQFTIEFPFPGADQRLAIWQRIWPKDIPHDDLDLEFMARRFEISGGNIRNIALSAAFLAAEDGACLRMKHLIRATWQEYQKMGKVVMDGEFGKYEHLSHAVL